MLLDISEGGLCFACPTELLEGAQVQVGIPGPGETIWVEGRVWHVRPMRIRRTETHAHGVVVDDPDDRYLALLPRGDVDCDGAADPAMSGPGVFRVRLKARGQPRTRVLSLAAEDAQTARRDALAKVGDGWEVLEVVVT